MSWIDDFHVNIVSMFLKQNQISVSSYFLYETLLEEKKMCEKLNNISHVVARQKWMVCKG